MLEKYDRVVRCSAGHLFTTVWIPMVSVKALRLGTARFQHCPVGRHWTTVRPVDEATLDAGALAQARAVHDARIP